MKFKAIKPVGMLVTAATAMSLVSCGSKQQQQMQMPAPQIATITVGYGTSDVESGYPATLKGKTDIDIRPQVTGFITKVCVDEGQQVHKGQVLFQLDPVQFQAAVESAEAQVRLAETSLATAQLTADNKRKLFDKNIISEYEWQLAANSLAQAKSQLSAAKAQLVSAKKNLAYTVVTAPSNGVIGSIPNREGSLASPSSAQPLTTVSDNSQIYAYFSLNEKDILKLAQNGAKSLNSSVSQMPEVSLRLANGEIYPEKGKVATVSGVIDNTTGAATVRALFENKSGMLRSGSTGMVLIPQSTDSVLLIPQKATFEMQDRKFVYVVNDSNIVSTQPITVSPVTDGKNFVVLSGLQPGQRIAVEGIGTKVRDGITIVPTDPSAAQQPAAQTQK
ncbi:efflux RND transporter periplasmic adaptor subunit [uncultured Muribaculum sp.]|uniref:efflux RND transporter periplasmic adaptor subunit n=4 Tax=uncultured Muribaculum sp. TaxID=1918613 RepID=UPI00258C07C3|nr:efflux RND transporter periplasmic adaptor subunit [uncultured Muribaculum sp.]